MKKGLIGFVAGLLSGIMIFEGFIVLLGRTGAPGGEIFIIPLIVILVAFGWGIGKEHGYFKGRDKGFYEGFKKGYFKGSQEQKVKVVLTDKAEDDGQNYEDIVKLPIASGN
jgi:hypothetical protein